MLALPAACESSDDATPYGLGVTVEDSAGVTIVTNDPPAPDSRLPWQFGAQPSLSIGSVDSGEAYELFRVTDATLLADGRIVIANAGSGELKVFNADGSHSGTWGRQGEGPGEFSSGPGAVALWPGDSIAAPGGYRVSLFEMDGNHGRDVALDVTLLGVVDPLPRREDLRERQSAAQPKGNGIPGPHSLRHGMGSPGCGRYARDVSLGEFPACSRTGQIPGGAGRKQSGEQTHPFGRSTVGSPVGRTSWRVGVQDSYEIKAFAPDGSLVRIVRRNGDPRKATQTELDEYFARLVAGRPPEQRAEALRSVRDMPLVDSYPAFEEILARSCRVSLGARVPDVHVRRGGCGVDGVRSRGAD